MPRRSLCTPALTSNPPLLGAFTRDSPQVVTGDATAELERGYFPSYSVPYFSEVPTRRQSQLFSLPLLGGSS